MSENQSGREQGVKGHLLSVPLVELLVVLAMGGVLAAVGVPKFLQADTASLVAESIQEMLRLGYALEAYAVDNGGNYVFDLDSAGWPWYPTDPLSTPVAYVSGATEELCDPFREDLYPLYGYRAVRYRYVNYEANREPCWPPSPLPGPSTSRWISCPSQSSVDAGEARYGEWRLSGSGPDTFASPDGDFLAKLILYDPTNGTISEGDIIISQMTLGLYQTGLSSWPEYR